MNPATNLFRQISQTFMQEGRVTSLAFKPMPKDKMCLSVYDGDLCSAQEAFEHFTLRLQCTSLGVLAVTVGECEDLALKARPDYGEHEYHALIDFSGKSKGDIRRAAERLVDLAWRRGWAFQSSAN